LHSTSKIPVIAVIGAKEVENSTVTLRLLGSDTQETMSLDDFVNYLKKRIDEIK
jgi:threonyl-tRNA synthetase